MDEAVDATRWRLRPARLLAGLALVTVGALGLAGDLADSGRWIVAAIAVMGAVLALGLGILSATLGSSRSGG